MRTENYPALVSAAFAFVGIWAIDLTVYWCLGPRYTVSTAFAALNDEWPWFELLYWLFVGLLGLHFFHRWF